MNSFVGNGTKPGKNDVKRRDYLVQQEKLRSMAQSATANKALDADSMIENLLSRSETFRKRKETSNQGSPAWLNCNSSSLPKIYKNVWLCVKSNSVTGSQQFCDTQFLTSILLTSSIPTESLGHIWALCNKTAPGLLTEQELYQVLALVALAQLGRPWNNLAVLEKLEEPVVPSLNYSLLAMSLPTVDPGIHSTYLPNRIAMSIPSPVQMFQNNNTSTVFSNNKTSFELNPSLLESMLSNNFNQAEGTASVVSPQTLNAPPITQPSKISESDFSDNWTEFIDHTANGSQTKSAHSTILKEPSLFGDSSQTAFGNDSVSIFDAGSQKNDECLNQLSLIESSISNFSSIVSNTPKLTQQNDVADEFSSLVITSTDNKKNEKIDFETDDEFTDFQSFDYPVANFASKNNVQPQNKIRSNIESVMKLNSALSSKSAPKKTEPLKNTFLSNESDEVVYGQKGYVVENPLYSSDNESIYDNNSVNSLKFDTISLDALPKQGSNSFSTSLVPGSKQILGPSAESKKQSPLPGPFIQVPSSISPNSSEDKYSVFRMLESNENLPKAQKAEDDDFGDFLTADISEPKEEQLSSQENILDCPFPALLAETIASEDQTSNLDYPQTQSLQEECVDACTSVLRSAVEKFSSLNPDVLKLVLCEDKCIDYIQALTEIYRIAERMIQSVNSDLYKDNLNNVWKDLNSYVSTKFSVEECEEENDYSCTLCNTSSGSAVIKYGMSYYHVPCINFYLNCVNSNLPD